MTAPTVTVHAADVRAVLSELNRRGPGLASAAAARLEEALAPNLFTPILSDPDKNTTGAHHRHAADTERAAAYAAQPRIGTQRRKVLDALTAHPDGLTDDELAHATGLYRYSAAPRRHELAVGGWVHDSGQRRPTTLGQLATVWTLTPAALERLAA